MSSKNLATEIEAKPASRTGRRQEEKIFQGGISMKKYPDIPELLEQFMDEQDTDERWITVREFRERFQLTRRQANTVSGFFRRLEFGTFGRFPFIVLKIERITRTAASDPSNCRYLVKRKGVSGAGRYRKPGVRMEEDISRIPDQPLSHAGQQREV